jgi:H+-translocating NAD(P) transhydrogenase subunit alpha
MENIAQKIAEMSAQLNEVATQMVSSNASVIPQESFLITAITVFILASFVGYYLVWNVTPTLHSPLMSVTNAISSIIIIGALIATQKSDTWWGFFAIIFASINIFGGFMVTHRMLDMFKDKKVKDEPKKKFVCPIKTIIVSLIKDKKMPDSCPMKQMLAKRKAEKEKALKASQKKTTKKGAK